MVEVDDIAVSVIMEIEKQPTAYDVDKVVEQMKELPRCSTWNHNSDNVDRTQAIEVIIIGGEKNKNG